MLSLLRPRMALARFVLRAARPSPRSVMLPTRRYLSTTRPVFFPTATKKTAKKPTTKKKAASKAKKPVKKTPAKKKVAAKAKKPRVVKKKKAPKEKAVVIKPEDKPPKKPSTPKGIYQHDRYEQLKNDGRDFSDIHVRVAALVELGQEWQNLSSAEKQPFVHRAEAAAKAYEEEYLQWYLRTPKDKFQEINRRKAKRKHNNVRLGVPVSLKAPPTGYIRFARTVQDPSLSLTENAVNAGRKWKELSDAERAKFTKEYKDEYAVHKESLAKLRAEAAKKV